MTRHSSGHTHTRAGPEPAPPCRGCGEARGELYIAGAGLARGLCGACGADGGAVCCGPVWCCGEPDVPHRGPGALARGRGAGVPGACGCAGEGARLPHRAGRDRGGAGAPCGCCAGGGDCARGRPRGQAAGWLCGCGGGCGARCGGVACASGAEPSGATWCRRRLWCWSGFRSRPTASSTVVRCRRRSARVGSVRRAAAHAAGGDPVRAVCGGAGAGACGDRRQLLCARGPFAAGDAADQPHPLDAGCRACDPQPVRGADG